MFKFTVDHMVMKKSWSRIIGWMFLLWNIRDSYGQGRGVWEQVQFVYLGKRPETANLKVKAAVTTAETRKNEFLEIIT